MIYQENGLHPMGNEKSTDPNQDRCSDLPLLERLPTSTAASPATSHQPETANLPVPRPHILAASRSYLKTPHDTRNPAELAHVPPLHRHHSNRTAEIATLFPDSKPPDWSLPPASALAPSR